MSAPTVLIMAAGTGGHIFPGLAIAKELSTRGWKVHWMGTPAGMENRLVAEAGYALSPVHFGGVRGKGLAAWLFLPARILRAFWQSWRVLGRVRPDVVLSMATSPSPAG
jgi:UDP-N-acetylglucosamine--N-acetylmuramyl-(pentapeptide) pyrophosphoryl-undecaprenol N-acetylglucosamine transferase